MGQRQIGVELERAPHTASARVRPRRRRTAVRVLAEQPVQAAQPRPRRRVAADPRRRSAGRDRGPSASSVGSAPSCVGAQVATRRRGRWPARRAQSSRCSRAESGSASDSTIASGQVVLQLEHVVDRGRRRRLRPEHACPTATSISCAATRTCAPARSSVPVSADVDVGLARERGRDRASSRRSGSRSGSSAPPASSTPTSDAVMASARLNARKSISGSGRSSRNGSTISRVAARTGGGVGTSATSARDRSADGVGHRARRLEAIVRLLGERAVDDRAGERPAPVERAAADRAARRERPRRRSCPGTRGWPVSISKSTTPTAKRSARASTGSPRICSGAM